MFWRPKVQTVTTFVETSSLRPGDWLATGVGPMVVRERGATWVTCSQPTWRDHLRAFVRGLWHGLTNFWFDVVLWWEDVAERRAQRVGLLEAGLARPPAAFWRLVFWRLGF